MVIDTNVDGRAKPRLSHETDGMKILRVVLNSASK
jgi:hypothetical protein